MRYSRAGRLGAAVVTLLLSATACGDGDRDASETKTDEDTAMAIESGSSIAAQKLILKQGDTTMETIVSERGTSTTLYDAAHHATRGATLRYRDGTVLGLDYATSTYESMSLDAAVTRKTDERTQLSPNMPELGALPTPPVPDKGLRSLRQSGVIGGVRAHAYGSTSAGREWRVWYADDLPTPHRSMRDALARLGANGANGAKPCGDCSHPNDVGDDDSDDTQRDSCAVARRVAGRTIVRAETREGSGWTLVVDLVSSQQTRVPLSTFDAPASWTRHTEMAKLEATTSANVVYSGAGPVSGHPEAYLFFWGSTFSRADHKPAVGELVHAYNDFYQGGYMGPLSQYGVSGGGLQNVYYDAAEPSSSLKGPSGYFDISAFVIAKSYSTSAPTFWWSVGGHDPIYTVLVPESIVGAGGGWDGYHAMAPTSADAILPFPVNLFAHDWMPWTVSVVPEDALSLPTEGTLYRSRCHADSTSLSFCGALDAFDRATQSASHELVEAATDPYPFFGWFDPTKLPPWDYAEISDICEFQPLPWGSESVVGSTAVATYWSNASHGCVPPSEPTLDITSPHDGDVLPWQTGGAKAFVDAVTHDPVDGTITPVRWSVDDGPPQTAYPLVGIGLGPHIIRATATDSQGLTATSFVHVTVVAKAPTATILSPANGSTVSAGPLLLRGRGDDPQDGTLPGSALAWSVDGAAAGAGNVITPAVTAMGDHTIALVVTNSAGLKTSASIVVHVAAATGLPSVAITAPADLDGESDPGVPVHFACTAVDGAGNAIPDANITWNDDKGGFMGHGASITVPLVGTPFGIIEHHITVTAVDAAGHSASDSIRYSTGQIP